MAMAMLCSVLLFGATTDERPIQVLLLVGSGGSHDPDRFASTLSRALEPKGVVLRVATSTDALVPEALAKADVVAIYKDDGELPPEREAALLGAIEKGKGLVAIHCASHCFRNSPRYGALVGGRFAGHGAGRFAVRIIDAQHPVTLGLAEFETEDETYRHNELGEDLQVLMVRPEAGGYEPSTWVRRHGEGRVFYTALGHDARTWENPAFPELVLRGIRWAAGRSPDPAPKNPLVDGKPGPLSPEDSRRNMHLPAGFRVELFAAEPDVVKPITMCFDDLGRLYVVESVDYPNDVLPEGAGHDRIKLCEDRNGDGRADRFTVFSERHNIPTSIAPWRGGLLVAEAPHILYLKDRNGDGVADERTAVLTGFHRSDTHAVHSNFRFGPDNWFWATIGYSGARVRAGGAVHSFSSGVFRFRPDGSALEVLTPTRSNTWGLGFDESGEPFLSKANDDHSLHLGIPNRFFERVRGWYGVGSGSIADHKHFHHISEDLRQVDYHGGYTAAAGQTIYAARQFPREYHGRAAFVCEPTGHLIHTDFLEPAGSSFLARDGYNLLASTDAWTAPIETHVGPDGALWWIDWYNYIVRHNPTPPGYKTGVGNAYITPERDRSHGRIYRIVHAGAKPSIPWRPAGVDDLLAELGSDNQWRRLTAQRLLVEHPDAEAARRLEEIVRQGAEERAVFHALGALEGMGRLREPSLGARRAVEAALDHPSPMVRKQAIRVSPRDAGGLAAILASAALEDADFTVRLAALLAAAESPSRADLGERLAAFLASEDNAGDRWLPMAATAAAAANDLEFLLAAAKRDSPLKAWSDSVRVVAEHYARAAPADSIGRLLAGLDANRAGTTALILDGLVAGWPEEAPPAAPALLTRHLRRLLQELPADRRLNLLRLARRWRLEGEFDRVLASLRDQALKRAAEESRPESERAAAAREIAAIALTEDVAEKLLELLSPRSSPEFAAAILAALAESEHPWLGNPLTKHWKDWTPATRRAATAILLQRPAWTAALVSALEERRIAAGDLSLDQIQRLRSHPDRAIARRAGKALGPTAVASESRREILEKLLPLAKKTGDASLGKEVFLKHCAKCHRHGELGQSVGPDLTGIAVRKREDILADVLDPNRSVEGNFRQYTLATADGRILTGLLAAETKTAVEILDAEGKRHVVLREDVETLTSSPNSLMPEGFEKLSENELACLLEYLHQRGRYTPLPIRTAATAVSTLGMFYDERNEIERIVLDQWGPREVFGVPFQIVDPQSGRVPNVILLYGPAGAVSRRMPRSVRLPCGQAARAVHLLSGISGWGYPLGTKGSVSLTVRFRYADGELEDHPLRNGVEFADYIRRVDVPGSKFAFLAREQQVRYLSIAPGRREPIDSIEFEKGPDATAPLILAVTVEGLDSPPGSPERAPRESAAP